MKLLDRYLAQELAWPFLTGVAAFSAILLGTNVLFQLVKLATSGVSLLVVLRLFLLGLPAIIVLTFPMAMLFSSLMAFGRLSGQSELIAMLASGINLFRMIVPVFVIAMGVTVLTWEFNESVVPWASRSASDLKAIVGEAIQPEKILLPQYVEGRRDKLAWANGYDRKRKVLKEVSFLQLDKNGDLTAFVNAPDASYDPKTGDWVFHNATVTQVLPGGYTRKGTGQVISLNVGTPEDVQKSTLKPETMTYAQLEGYIADRKRQGIPTVENEVSLHQKVALPFTSLVFAAVGVPLGIRPSRKSSGFGLGLGFSVLIIFGFYVLSNYLAVLGGKGVIDPIIAAWLPNLITFAFGIILLVKAPK